MTPGMRRMALLVLALCASAAAGVGAFWLAADSVARLAGVPRA